MLLCSTKRAMGNASDDTPLDMRSPPRNPWLDGWADVLDIINSHAQARAPGLASQSESCRQVEVAGGLAHVLDAGALDAWS
jgi:hypothetical protein